MIPSLKTIEQELETLDSQLDQLAHQLYDAYQEYLISLGQAVRRQLILACYHLCTQGYPEHFLDLSLSQRQEFQKELRDLAQRSQTELLNRLPNLPTFNNEEPDDSEDSEPDDADESVNQETDEAAQWSEDTSDEDTSESWMGDRVTDRSQSLDASPHASSIAHPLTDLENSPQDEPRDEIDQSDDTSPTENNALDLSSRSAEPSDLDLSNADLSNTEFSNPEASQSQPSPADQSSENVEQENADNDAQTASFFEFVLQSRAPHSPSDSGDSSGNSSSLDRNSLPAPSPPESIPHLDPESQAKLAALAALLSSGSREQEDDEPDETLTPRAIARWHEQAEDNITDVLHTLSHTTNRVLQTYHILGMNLPDPVLEVASKTELVSESAPPLPNLLKLRIEAETEEKEALETAQLLIIHLRLSEIEFGDPSLSPKRSRIRELLARLQQMGRKYYRKQRERAIAEAESAWRASWFEE